MTDPADLRAYPPQSRSIARKLLAYQQCLFAKSTDDSLPKAQRDAAAFDAIRVSRQLRDLTEGTRMTRVPISFNRSVDR